MQMLSRKLIYENVEQVDELLIYTSEKVQEPTKQIQLKELLENIKKFLLDKRADSSRKAEIILKMPLLQLTVKKA